MADEEAKVAEKKQSPLVLAGVVALLTLVAGGGGWFLGLSLAPPPPAAEEVAAPTDAPQGEEAGGHPAAAGGVVLLDPINGNLAYPAESRVRLEVALTFRDAPDPALAEVIHQDILAYMRTVSLQQVQGPRGFQYLREDLEERVDLRSEGRVTGLLFRTFVIE